MNYRAVFLIGLSLALPRPGWTQARVSLAPARDTVAEEFLSVSSAHELGDGRVVIADPRARRVVVADFATGRASAVGRVGDGPGEYRSPRQLLRLGGDTLLLFDTQLRRLSYMIAGGLPIPIPPELARSATRFEYPIRGAARDGRILALVPLLGGDKSFDATSAQLPTRTESVLVVTSRLADARTEVIARLRGRFRGLGVTRRTSGSRVIEFELANPFGVEEQAWLFPDGWIAVVYSDPYRVSWIDPAGKEIVGAPLQRARQRANAEERTFAIAREWPTMPAPPLRVEDFRGWPDFVPPFPIDALVPMRDGRIAIERMLTSHSSSRAYDIVDRSGSSVTTIAVHLRERIVGFGTRWVYIASRDDDGIERLTRHPLSF